MGCFQVAFVHFQFQRETDNQNQSSSSGSVRGSTEGGRQGRAWDALLGLAVPSESRCCVNVLWESASSCTATKHFWHSSKCQWPTRAKTWIGGTLENGKTIPSLTLPRPRGRTTFVTPGLIKIAAVPPTYDAEKEGMVTPLSLHVDMQQCNQCALRARACEYVPCHHICACV